MKFRKQIKKLVQKSTGRKSRAKSPEQVGRIPDYSSSSSAPNGSSTQQPVQLLHSNVAEQPLHDASVDRPSVVDDRPAIFDEGQLLGDFSDGRNAVDDIDAPPPKYRDSGIGSTTHPDNHTVGPFDDQFEHTGTPYEYENDYSSVSSLGDEALDIVPSIFPEPSGGSRLPEEEILSYMRERASSRTSLNSEPQLTRGSSVKSNTSRTSNYTRHSWNTSGASLPSHVQNFTAAEYARILPDPQSYLADEILNADPNAQVDVMQTTAKPVTHEWVHPNTVEERKEVITREVHTHEVREIEQPIIQREFAPPKHFIQQPDGRLVPALERPDGTFVASSN